MPRGRPVKSQIRQNMVEILNFVGSSSGYDLYKVYVSVYPKVTMRSIYYHLKKGVSLGEFQVDKIEKVKGDYSWGPEAEKIFYTLGSNAKPRIDERVKEFLDEAKRKSEKKPEQG
ncbi:MAG: hypothetical protein KJ922_03205 [Nanoarchaeota archaeon]|nr:hypothetical protein [Nanoarchaeota archaeon]